MNKELQTKILAVTVGSKLGCILRCALGVERDAVPRFNGRATVTSDGYVMCDFTDKNGEHHWGAFVSAKADLNQNVIGLASHLSLNLDDTAELFRLIDSWLGIEFIDMRSAANKSKPRRLPGEMGPN